MKIFERGVKKKYSSIFKISYRSEFLSDFNNRMCVEKLRSRRIQKNKSFFSCVHLARRMAKIWGLTILNLFCAWWVHIKWDLFFWILRDLSFLTHTRWLKSNKNSLLCDIFKIWWKIFFDPSLENFHKKVIFEVRVQILKYRTEASFCPILIIECALESWDPVEFKKICQFFLACILHAQWPKYGG